MTTLLIADGRTIKGGPLVAEADVALVGITVLRAASLDEAKAIAAADPAVLAPPENRGHATLRDADCEAEGMMDLLTSGPGGLDGFLPSTRAP